MYSTCSSVDSTLCPDCVSGSLGCNIDEGSNPLIGLAFLNTNEFIIPSLGYFIMVISGYDGPYLEDVELLAIDQTLHPVPDCLTQLNPLPNIRTLFGAGAVDYSSKLEYHGTYLV